MATRLKYAGLLSAVWRSYSAALLPLPRLTVSEFAEKYRRLTDIESAEAPGMWSNDYLPCLRPVMNAAGEAVEKGKRGFVCIKGAQVGGSQAMTNVWSWCQAYYPGPMAFLESRDEDAEEFGRERFGPAVESIAPLKRKLLPGRRGGGTLTRKRFVDGTLRLFGGRSVLNLQSHPYRFIFIDEPDSLMDNLGNMGDPFELARRRLDSFRGQKLMFVFGHPSEKTRGAAYYYYAESDQRRAHIICPRCNESICLRWESCVKAMPRPGQSQEQAERDASCYGFYCPACRGAISDAERVAALAKVSYRSVLPPEEVARRTWIGVHVSQLGSPHKTIRELAEDWIGGLDDPNKRRVFVNRVEGEPFESAVKRATPDQWRACIVTPRPGAHSYGGVTLDRDPEAYRRGEVPWGVRFLTAGQDTRNRELHYAIWGWGVRRVLAGYPALFAWLIEYGVIARDYAQYLANFSEAEYHAFDALIYRASFPTAYNAQRFGVLSCGHDTGYQASQIALYQYVRCWPGRAFATKGAGSEPTSASRSKPFDWGGPLHYRAGKTDVVDPATKLMVLNTYTLKMEILGMTQTPVEVKTPAGPRQARRLSLPTDVDDEMIAQLSNEELRLKGKHEVWMKTGTGQNHYADCLVGALGCALNLDPFQQGLPFEEAEAAQAQASARRRRPAGGAASADDPALG